MSEMVINTTGVTSVCSTYKSAISSADLASIDVTSAFEPFTSVGVLTSYVPSLKEALASINDNCNSLCSILENLANTQQGIDDSGKQKTDTGYFNDYGGNNYRGSNRSGSSNSSGGQQDTSVDNKNQEVGVNAPDVEQSLQQLATDEGFMQALLSIASTSPSAITSEERASYLKELLKIKNQNNQSVVDVIDSLDPSVLQQYLQKILNGELPITDVSQSVTFDILEQIAKENGCELVDLFKGSDLSDHKTKVQSLADEYLTLFNSNNLKTDLLAVYDGTETDKYSDEFTTSIRTTLDIIALNKDTTSEELLSNAEYDTYLKEQVSSVVAALNEIKAVCTKSDSEFVTGLGKILDENNELFTNATTTTTTTTNTNVSASNTTLTEDVTVPGATELA